MNDEHPNPPSEARAERTSLMMRIRALFGMNEASVREDLEEVLDESSADAELSAHERTMLKNVLNLHDVRVNDIMIPRADIIGASIGANLGEILAIFRAAEHSRLPVYGETLDDPRGMIHIRDFIDFIAARAEKVPGGRRKKIPVGVPDLGKVDLTMPLSAAKILRPVLFVPPSMPALDLLVKMQTTRTHMALVIDEYGGTDGLVSIEDLVEIVVGNIEDEHDLDETPMIMPMADGSFVIDARANLEDVSKVINIELMNEDIAEDVETIGGLVGALAGRVPIRGEIISNHDMLEFEILDADPRRLKRVRVH